MKTCLGCNKELGKWKQRFCSDQCQRDYTAPYRSTGKPRGRPKKLSTVKV